MTRTQFDNAVGDWLVRVIDLPKQRRARYIHDHCHDQALRQAVIAQLDHPALFSGTYGVHPHNLIRLFESADAAMAGLDASALTADPPGPGTTLRDPATGRPRWQILGMKQGGMSLIYYGVDLVEEIPFAAKTFPRAAFDEIPSLAVRFRFEANTWLMIPPYAHVAPARSVEIIAGRPFLFMDYYPQGDLSSLVGTPELRAHEPGGLFQALHICDGLIHAYAHGVVAHRDVKPSNCLIQWLGSIALTDFGIAKPSNVGVDLGAQAGTPEYLAPEQASADSRADQRADIYALGATLYELFTGERVFGSRPAVTRDELEHRHAVAPVPEIPGAPAWLNAIVARCLAKDPADRFQTVAELREILSVRIRSLTGWTNTDPLPSYSMLRRF